MFLELPGRVAIVTGAARGIGFAIAERLSRAGARVVVADVDEDSALAAVGRLREGGAEAVETVTDITNPEEVEAMVERAIDAFGRLDVLVNNAGITGRDASLSKITDEDWDRVLKLNLTAAFYCCRAAIPRMREQRSGSQRSLHLGKGRQPEHDPLFGLQGWGDLLDQGFGQGGDQ